MWYDNWCPQGPLSNFITKRVLYDARLDVGTKVVSMINDGKWMWPEGWEDNFDILKEISVPILQLDKKDKVVWVNRNMQQVEFSTTQAWQDLRCNWPTVEWKDVVWFKQLVPRHAFMLWLALQEKLMTQDRIARWKQISMQCSLCRNGIESHKHLFFKCKFTEEIWNRLSSLRWNMKDHTDLQDIVQEIKVSRGRNNFGVVVNKLILAAAIYYIWQERNHRIFQDKERNEEAISNIIKESVRIQLISIRVRKTKNVIKISDQWKLKWENFSPVDS
uniref:uncharacterized protein LOC122596919 n=1 Tax=Erigeron canadensis TaxID=72917 RepID=UPI001CB943D6|nr:uncharacterized protein LOC122596919 [Erigeron canadensis]